MRPPSPRGRAEAPPRRARAARYLAPAALVAAGLTLQFAPWPGAWVDGLYLAGWFPRWQRLATGLTGRTDVSLSLALLGALLTVLAACAAWGLAARPGGQGGVRARRALPLLAAWSVGVLTAWFPLGFGLAYRGGNLAAAAAALPTPDPAVVRGWLLEYLATAAAALDGAASTSDADARVAAADCVNATAAALRRELLPATAPARDAAPAPAARVKELPAGTLLRLGYAGVVSPWLLEPHVDAGLPPVARLGVALHELAHVAGFAQEAEAEAVAHLAGITCDNPNVRYAAAVRLAGGVAAGMDPAATARFVDAWPARAVADTEAAARAAARFEAPLLKGGANAVYDAYLRAQGGADGLAGYGRGTRLGLRLLHRAGALVDAGRGGVGAATPGALAEAAPDERAQVRVAPHEVPE